MRTPLTPFGSSFIGIKPSPLEAYDLYQDIQRDDLMTNKMRYDRLNPFPWGAHVKIKGLIGKDKKVLDVGCATGKLASELKTNGNIVYGIEIDPEQAEIAGGICEKVFVGNIEMSQLDLPEKFFDVIIFADVLEHLNNPEYVLIKMKRFLKDNGFMVISLPNIAHISMRINLLFGSFDYSELGILDRTHLRFFTLKTARELIRNCGFRILSTDITIPSISRINSTKKRYSPLYKTYCALSNSWRTGLAFQFIFKISE